jgi:hypothetical protein
LEIKGSFDHSREVYTIIASFRSSILREPAPIDFVVDSGSSRTTINDKDAARLGVEYCKLDPIEDSYYGMGGTDVAFFSLPKCRLLFTSEEGKKHPEDLDDVIVARHKFRSKRQKKLMATYPSLLGLDILKNYEIHFTNYTVTLEL